MSTVEDERARYQMALRGQKDELTQVRDQRDDLLTNHYTPLHGGASTAITYAAAGAEGSIRAFFGAKANMGGMVPITGIIGVLMAGAAFFVNDPTANEALNAGARGMAAPAISNGFFRFVTSKRDPDLEKKYADLDAFLAARAAAPSSTATAAAGAVAGVAPKAA